MEKVHLIYFSPALSTRRVMRMIAESTGLPVTEHDVTMGIKAPINIASGELAIFGIPVYSGRVPLLATEAFRQIRGNRTPAVIINVYGNRDYDDALLELRDICEANGFVPLAAGAFIARHSIFSGVAEGRPDMSDKQKIEEFGKYCLSLYRNYDADAKYKQLEVKGNYPYKELTAGAPYMPLGDEKCDSCGTCVKQCPVGAIPADNPLITDVGVCIRCARCIALCPQHSRDFRGEMYETIKAKFAPFMAARREPEVYYV